MGFTTGLLGGVTLTSGILYITIGIHTQNRLMQSALLRQQRAVLTSFSEPQPPQPELTSREVTVGIAEVVKDRWNRELESLVRRAYTTDWRRVREQAEDKVSEMVQILREKSK